MQDAGQLAGEKRATRKRGRAINAIAQLSEPPGAVFLEQALDTLPGLLFALVGGRALQ